MAGYGLMGYGMMGYGAGWLYWLFWLAITAFAFSAIFWATYKWLINPDEKQKR